MGMTEQIAGLKTAMAEAQIDPAHGLGNELFLFASTLMPVVNVDILATNSKGEMLLSWRDDPHCGRGWHVPGGCVRLNETFETRIQKTALAELGTEVVFDPVPIGIYQIFAGQERQGLKDQRERAHFITVAFHCRLPEEYQIGAERMRPETPGSLKWFADLPENLLKVQDCYKEHWNEISDTIRRSI